MYSVYIIQWYNFGNAIYNTDTEYTRAIASTLIHAVVPHPFRIHKPVLGTRYSGTVTTVPCRKTCTNHDNIVTVYYVQLHIDDTIPALLMT